MATPPGCNRRCSRSAGRSVLSTSARPRGRRRRRTWSRDACPMRSTSLKRSQLEDPAIRDAVLITLHTGFDIRFVTLPLRRRAARRRPEQCARRSPGARHSNTRTREASAANDWAQLRANLGAILSQLRRAVPRTRIVIGTYDNGYRTCNLSAAPAAKTQAIVAGYLEGVRPVRRWPQQRHPSGRVPPTASSRQRSRICSVPETGPPTASIRADAGHAKIAQASSRLRGRACAVRPPPKHRAT